MILFFVGRMAGFIRVVLPINKAILEPARLTWHTPATCAPTPKKAEKKYLVPARGAEFLFTYPAPNSLVIQVAIERSRQQH